MSSLKRYYALNQQVFRLREGKPIEVEIQGKDSLHLKHKDVMLEAAATSLQIHLQVHPAEAVRQYNIAQILSAPMVAVAANSPYLFGRDLWDETRIPTFEQAVSVASFRDHRGTLIERVTFGTGYGRFSLMEPFLENLDGFPILLPLVFDEDPSWLSHLRLHNGTIWRWNRPLIGIDDRGKPHLRIEHRVAAAGPSIPDIVANIAFYLGMVNFFVRSEPALDQRISFETARKNFYQAARDGWDATLQWVDGKAYPLRTLLEETLLPAARDGLKRADINSADISRYIDDIMTSRIRTGQNGARWQRAFIQAHGRDFAELTHAYHTNQRRHIPVHEWTI
ncbi:MAG: hypothetical protein GWM98_07840 [Nitrospinaceae bacterium]|nr:hypothetical protein [Nitrospinaceae bacterium]NIR55091.1 hypothetical protein [Nitrospinaceae bacterium]NIS85500.1 hypothetical protein [Nitrospinaceae bacterium]NIT81648.1 hypothetical protein [Nitrospinaceae bacterium]NIU44556.1 hypothetical protein [Nitrospinaceae bacterium]